MIPYRMIPYYLTLTGDILALFIVIEAPTAPSLEEFGAGKAAGIIVGVFVGCFVIAHLFFIPYFKRRLVQNDARVKFYHIPLGPLLLRENPPLYFPGKGDAAVISLTLNSFPMYHRFNRIIYPLNSSLHTEIKIPIIRTYFEFIEVLPLSPTFNEKLSLPHYLPSFTLYPPPSTISHSECSHLNLDFPSSLRRSTNFDYGW
jgi:hypothetical protein